MNRKPRHVPSTFLVLCSLLAGCGAPPWTSSTSSTQRLVDDFSPALVSGPKAVKVSSQRPSAAPAFLWTFEDPGSAEDWHAAVGIDGLTVRGGHLVGQASGPSGVLRLNAIPGIDPGDMLYEVQVRMRVSAGQKLGVHFVAETPDDLTNYILSGAPLPWPNETSITAGEGMTTFSLRPVFPVYGSEIHDLLLRPTDAPGATFEIESVRVIFRHERLASIPSGVGWLGMDEIYRETVVSRSPEVIRWPVTLPDDPRLTLNLATLDERPVTFRVGLETGGNETALFERTLTTPHRWEEASADLDAWRGKKVTLTMSLVSEEPGSLGVWAAPTVLRRQPTQTADGRPQGVILIFTDTLRPDRLEAYGNQRHTAPTVARLAREGALFRDAQSPAAWTKVAAPPLLTGLYPMTLGVRDFQDRVPSAAVTLAEAYRKAGYTTLGFSSAPFAGAFSNLHQGYEELHESPLTLASSKTSRPITDRLLPWLDKHHDEPFFAMVHYFDPHAPYRPDPPYDRLWRDTDWVAEQESNGTKVISTVTDPERLALNMITIDDFKTAGVDVNAYRENEFLWYDGSIREMDTELERLLERLKELNLDQNTLLVFTSDHGEEFYDHELQGHGQSIYSELTHVPLIVHYPGVVPPGLEVAETVGLVDVMPTMLALSGLAVPEGVDGQSLAPLLKKGGAGAWTPRPVFADRPAAQHFASPTPKDRESYFVIHEGWKLIWNVQRKEGKPEFELFDHKGDPRDRTNVAARHPDKVKSLSRLIDGWRKDSEKRRLPTDEMASRDLRPEERERLRALGYIR